LSSGVGKAVERGGCAGSGLDAAVEPSGEGALEAAADVSMRLDLGEAFGFVAGFVVAAQSGHRHCVESTIEVPVAGAAQSVSGVPAAAGLERGDTSQRGECGLLRTRPQWDQLTRSWAATTGPTPGSASSAGPAACCGRRADSSASWSAVWVLRNRIRAAIDRRVEIVTRCSMLAPPGW
jgi:hypothetical protein